METDLNEPTSPVVIAFHEWDNTKIGNNANFYSKRAFAAGADWQKENIIKLFKAWDENFEMSIHELRKRIKEL